MCLAASFCLVVKRVPKVAGMLIREITLIPTPLHWKRLAELAIRTFVRKSLSARCCTVPPDFKPNAASAWPQFSNKLVNFETSNWVDARSMEQMQSEQENCLFRWKHIELEEAWASTAMQDQHSKHNSRPGHNKGSKTHVKRVCKENSKITLGT